MKLFVISIMIMLFSVFDMACTLKLIERGIDIEANLFMRGFITAGKIYFILAKSFITIAMVSILYIFNEERICLAFDNQT